MSKRNSHDSSILDAKYRFKMRVPRSKINLRNQRNKAKFVDFFILAIVILILLYFLVGVKVPNSQSIKNVYNKLTNLVALQFRQRQITENDIDYEFKEPDLSHRRENDRERFYSKVNHDLKKKDKNSTKMTVATKFPKIKISGGGDLDPEIGKKRRFIKQMMKDAWDNYVQYAWGYNELQPVSQSGHVSGTFGSSNLGATIIDSIDTLYIMGLHEEYTKARDWIAYNLDFNYKNGELSVFELNIRIIGGLLSAFAFTGDSIFKEKAYKLGKLLLPAFETSTGIPYPLINLHSGATGQYGWTVAKSSILAEFGTLHLEFLYLSDITGDPVFREKVDTIRENIKSLDTSNGLYSNFVKPTNAGNAKSHVSMGGLGDSFYEYLLKSYLQTGDMEARQLFDDAIQAFEKNRLVRKSTHGLIFLAELDEDRMKSKMDHLACFTGGMFALAAITDPTVDLKKGSLSARASRYMKYAKEITKTCHESYNRTVTKLGPEVFRFEDGVEAQGIQQGDKSYSLRPEVIESYFYLWRLTGDKKYREWGWDAAQAIEKHCKVGKNGGYSGIDNVYMENSMSDNVQQSYFLAETLKYLYLLFSSDDLLDLEYWVFNTEAHPLPIKGKNPMYRAGSVKKAVGSFYPILISVVGHIVHNFIT